MVVRRAVLVAGGVVVAAAIGTLAVAATVARKAVTPPTRPERPARIVRATADSVTLTRYLESERPGRYALWFDDDRGFAKVGEILAEDETTVTRRIIALEQGQPEPGMSARLSAAYYRHPVELGVPVDDVMVPTRLGPMPAWHVPAKEGRNRDWAILVHGRNATRGEPIRAVPVLREHGWDSLIISYRNDPGAPASPSGRYRLGDSEWKDVNAAIAVALRSGARRIVLMGWSMGGQTVLQTLLRGDLAPWVHGAVLDSPAIDWRAVVKTQTRRMRLRQPIPAAVDAILTTRGASRLAGLSKPISLARLSPATTAEALAVPTLYLQGEADPTTPVESARDFAAARPDLVEYVEFPGAAHVRIWNSDEARYAAVLGAWLDRVP